jgi:hypothetical protein
VCMVNVRICQNVSVMTRQQKTKKGSADFDLLTLMFWCRRDESLSF